ncbi:hypothetical protein D3C75_1123160 [compost metagenome]
MSDNRPHEQCEVAEVIVERDLGEIEQRQLSARVAVAAKQRKQEPQGLAQDQVSCALVGEGLFRPSTCRLNARQKARLPSGPFNHVFQLLRP